MNDESEIKSEDLDNSGFITMKNPKFVNHLIPRLEFKKLHPEALIPKYDNLGSVSINLSSIQNVIIKPGERKLIKTGLMIRCTRNHLKLQAYSLSNSAINHGIFVLTDLCLIGDGIETSILLHNLGSTDFVVQKGMKIAQLFVIPIFTIEPQNIVEVFD